MLLKTSDVSTRFGIERAEYKKKLSEQFNFLIGKYFGMKGKEEKSKDKYFGLIEKISCSEEYNNFTGFHSYKLTITYKNQKDEIKDTNIIFEESIKKRTLIYGDDPDSVKLELTCTEK